MSEFRIQDHPVVLSNEQEELEFFFQGKALNAAGGSLEAMKQVMDHQRPCFVLPRPPGHHAGPHYNGGFCYFNNVALAAEVARNRLGKVAIIDIDVHHGNGTNDIFYQDPEVLFISTHQYGIFPGTGQYNEFGSGEGESYTVNIPFMPQAGDASMELAFDSIIMKTLEQFQPAAILLSLGTDGHYNDPLSSNQMSSTAYVEVLRRLLSFANENCQDQLLVNLEGGYHVESLAEVLTSMVSLVETGEETLVKHNRVLDSNGTSRESITQTRDTLGRFWKF